MQRQRKTEKQEDWQKNSDVKTELAERQTGTETERQPGDVWGRGREQVPAVC